MIANIMLLEKFARFLVPMQIRKLEGKKGRTPFEDQALADLKAFQARDYRAVANSPIFREVMEKVKNAPPRTR